MSKRTGVDLAIEKAGGQSALARLISTPEFPITPQAVQQWQEKGFVPPPRSQDEPNRILDVERVTGVHRHLLNGAVYPEQPVAA